jgi:hypothetical protein
MVATASNNKTVNQDFVNCGNALVNVAYDVYSLTLWIPLMIIAGFGIIIIGMLSMLYINKRDGMVSKVTLNQLGIISKSWLIDKINNTLVFGECNKPAIYATSKCDFYIIQNAEEEYDHIGYGLVHQGLPYGELVMHKKNFMGLKKNQISHRSTNI